MSEVKRAKPKESLVEFMILEKDNLDDVARWCNGYKSGLTQVEFYSQVFRTYSKAALGQCLVKESENPRHFATYNKEEFILLFEEVTSATPNSE